jgi:ERCC4-type nuclease
MKVLHTLCNKLDMKKVPFFVGHLSIGDYVFFTKDKDGSMDLLCPILVERKSVQDIAGSINDGRWHRQKRRMYAAQHIFGYNNCKMVYIIEGNIDKETVSGAYIGARWLNVGVEQLHEEIANLQSEGFDVLRTTSAEHSMFQLARWALRVAQDLKSGQMEARYTYQRFKQEVVRIPVTMDFSRIAKDHAATRLSASAASIGPHQVTQQIPVKRQPMDTASNDDYASWKRSELEAECEAAGLAKSGKRSALIDRLRGPRPPKIWLERKQRNQYVPASYNVGATALLVALYLHEEEVGCSEGITKDNLYVKAEALNITKNPFSGGTTQTGPYHYDGWSNMSSLLSGDPPLVFQKKGKFKLTRNSDIAGYPVAKAMHKWCHDHDNCSCSFK